ncbi:DUF2089 domain-containing protein [Thalassoglobus neptunius]|nr:DUF2089 domain-containing protein [Thalassoglobus neptunius]
MSCLTLWSFGSGKLKFITNECPYCSQKLNVTEMSCSCCEVSIRAEFPESRLSSLPTEHQRFIEMFILAGGNLKEIAQLTGVSYPTVRSRLNKIIETLREEIGKTSPTRGNLLDAMVDVEEKSAATRQENRDALNAGKLIKSI